jgi:hypothetical protein
VRRESDSAGLCDEHLAAGLLAQPSLGLGFERIDRRGDARDRFTIVRVLEEQEPALIE